LADPVFADGVTPLNAANMNKLQTRDEKGQANGYAGLDGTGLVPAAQLPAAAVSVPTGAALDWFGSTAPAGFLLCDGSAVSRSTYAALFAAIGVVYGSGDGTTTFNLPDTRGRMLVGVSPGGNAEVSALGANDGTAAAARRVRHAHTSTLTLPNHGHSVNDPTHSHAFTQPMSWDSRSWSGASFNPYIADGGGTQQTIAASATGVTVGNPTSNPAISGTIGVTGGTADGPSYLVANKIIKT
jgi:microcystin-dependent protein